MARLVLLSSAFLLGCSEFGLSDQQDLSGQFPEIELEPEALQFARLRSGQTETQSFVIRNVGVEPLDVSEVQVAAGFGFSLLTDPAPAVLQPNEEVLVEVEFAPSGQDENFGRILVLSDDPERPEAPVDLLGYGDVPDLVIEPADHNFGQGFVPCGAHVELTLRNVGAEELVITDLDYTSLGGLTVPLEELRAGLPYRIQPDGFTNLVVTWEPSLEGAETGTLEVTSNDPGGVEKAYQSGEGRYVNELTETFTEPSEPAVDVVFLIDQSCSMQVDNEPTLTAGIPGFFDRLEELADWQLIQVTKGNACANGGVANALTPNVEDLFTSNAFGWLVSDTLSEALLGQASKALSKTGPGDCNDGAVREGALLHIIIASDEPEQSNVRWDQHLLDFESYVVDRSLLKVSGILDINGACGDKGQPSGASGYEQAVTATGGVLLDICSGTWGDDLPSLVDTTLDGLATYQLSEDAVGGSIRVVVNGTSTTGFTFGEATNSVTVESPEIVEGDIVEITYAVAADCGE